VAPPRNAPAARGNILASPEGRNVKVYDFKRPDKFSKDQIRTLSIIHETMARSATTALSAMLRLNAHVHVALVDQMTYEEFLRSIPDPTTIAVIPVQPLKAAVVLEVDPTLSSAITERLFGGPGMPLQSNRELTDIEGSVMGGVIERLLGCLQAAWSTVVDVKPRLAGIETRPGFAQVVHPNEMIVLVGFEAEIGGGKGMMNLVIPYLTIEPVIPRLSARYVYSTMLTAPEAPRASASSLPMTMEVSYEGDPLPVSALTRLSPGMMIGMPGFGRGEAFLQGGGTRILRLTSRRPGRVDTPGYTIADTGAMEKLRALAGQGRTATEKKTDAIQEAFQALSAGVTSSMRSMEEKIQELSRRSEELADQVVFQDPDRAAPVPGEKEAKERPFSFLTITSCDPLASLLREEHPQCAAMVLSHLDPGLAACILEKLAEENRTEITERICTMSRVAPELLREVENVLRRKLAPSPAEDMTSPGGVAAAVEILNVGSRGLEKQVVESLEKRNPELAEEIKKNMFVFEDIVLLDRETVGRILAEVAEEDLLLAMKAVADEKVRTHIWQCVSAADRERLQARLAASGRARLADVERAQQGIVAVIRRMEQAGNIVVGREGELVG
jgi:flagellar motor switch protein FliM/flagellar motor switch protein FliG